MPLDLGPVFRFETRRPVGRKGWYLLRVLLVVMLAGLFVLAQWSYSRRVEFGYPARVALSFAADTYSGLFSVIGLVLAFVIAPLAAVDVFNRHRGKYMLTLLLVTRLSGREIVWQSFAAGLVTGVTMWLCMLPFALFLISWWGVDPTYVAIVAAVSLSSMAACVASAVAFSLWSRGLFSTIVAVYVLWAGWLIGTSMLVSPGVFPAWVAIANPFVLLSRPSGRMSHSTLANAAFFASGAALFTFALLEITAATFRRSVLAREKTQTGKMSRKIAALTQALGRRPAWYPVPTLDGNPILWLEWRRTRSALGWQVFWILYVLGTAVATVIGAHAYWAGEVVRPILAGAAGYEVGIGVLALAIQAGLAWSDEKSAGQEGIDLLLSTPLSAATIVNGKWWGVYHAIGPVAVFPLISSLILLSDAPGSPTREPGALGILIHSAVVLIVIGQVLLYGAAFASLGLFLATRCAKPAHAVVWTVGIYFAVAMLVPTVAEMLFLQTDRPLAWGLAMASPIAAPIAAIMTRFPGPIFGPAEYVYPYAATWLLVAAVVAWGLHRSTIQQFDRRMGRIPAAGRRSGPVADQARVALGSGRSARDHQSARG